MDSFVTSVVHLFRNKKEHTNRLPLLVGLLFEDQPGKERSSQEVLELAPEPRATEAR